MLDEELRAGSTPGVSPVGDGVSLWEELLAGVIIKPLVAHVADIVLCRAQVARIKHECDSGVCSLHSLVDNAFAGLGNGLESPCARLELALQVC